MKIGTDLLRDLRQLYSLDTLDTRFIVPASAPPKEALQFSVLESARAPLEDDRIRQANGSGRVEHSRWLTPEYCFYLLVIAICLPLMFKSVVDVSRESHPNYPGFRHLLQNGWIPGRKVDNSDLQYASFRQNIPYLVVVMVLHPLLRKTYDSFWRISTYRPSSVSGGLTMGLAPSAAADLRLDQRVSFDVAFACAFLVALHGVSAAKIVVILFFNYSIAKKVPRRYMPAATWAYALGILFANELTRGYSFVKLVGGTRSSHAGGQDMNSMQTLASAIDSYGGLVPRWEVLFNFTILRLISFNLDYHWSVTTHGGNSLEKKQLDPSNLSERNRISLPAKAGDYSFRNYFAYTMYSPLYLAGPILTFNDYISQLRYRPYSIAAKRTALYAVRFAVVLLTMEIMIHYMYMVAIFAAKPDYTGYTPAQLSMLGFFNLKHIWLKLLIPWRFFRLWALLDGIDPPENMVRCMSDNYSLTQFWRGWHRSFNKWSLRYLFIPLGGSAQPGFLGKCRTVVNYLIVFSFIAIWHDIQLRLLMWGWLVTLFVLPEIAASMLFPAKSWNSRPDAYRYICGVGAVGEILLLMAANLVGFALGLDGLASLLHAIVHTWSGLLFFSIACGALFVGVQVMFEWRESEKRRGIKLKC